MAVTAPTDVAAWVPSIISTQIYDTTLASTFPLTGLAQTYPDLEGKAGEAFTIPKLNATTPADNLAVTTAAVDDLLSGTGVEVTIKEAVKSIAFYDRTTYATGTDFNRLAGQKVGAAIADRVELDLGAAAYAGRATAQDLTLGAGGTLTIANLATAKNRIPAALRRTGQVVVVGKSLVLEQLLNDPAAQNAATFGSDEAIRDGAFSRPIRGVLPVEIDDATIPNVTIATVTYHVALVFVRGLVARAVQKAPSSRPERDERARLTRIVGTSLHGEGVVDTRGVIAVHVPV